MPNIDSLFKEHNISANKLKAVACIRGPGSFTGLRIGLSIAKALALALDIPLYTENGLMLQALEAENRGLPVLSLIPAREKSYYALLIKNGQEQIERKIYSSQEIISIGKNYAELLLVGEGGSTFYDEAKDDISLKLLKYNPASRVQGLLQYCYNAYALGQKGESLDIAPEYMRKSEAEESLEKNHGPIAEN